MEARIKQKNLPPAPKPTLPSNALDPREKNYWEKFAEHSDLMKGFTPPKVGRKSAWSQDKTVRLKHMWQNGEKVSVMAERFGLEEKTVRYKLSYLIKQGELRPRKRSLTSEEKDKVTEFYSQGMTMTSIARHFGVNRVTVSNAIKERKK